ncbi:hypothetical protein AV521_14300 [Streptomyces sp. IMTB 2501]|nr:hypothetical protein AV521_14300 [Streptomyces sp. IMTB 2501]
MVGMDRKELPCSHTADSDRADRKCDERYEGDVFWVEHQPEQYAPKWGYPTAKIRSVHTGVYR